MAMVMEFLELCWAGYSQCRPWFSCSGSGHLSAFLAVSEGTIESWTGDLLWISLMPPVAIEGTPSFDVPVFAK